MRIVVAWVVVMALVASAAADAKITQLIKFYEKENGTCRKILRGVTVVIERGKPVAGKDPDLATDLAELAKAQATVQTHCDEIAALVEFLKASSSGTYKQIEKDFGERDKKIRAGRATSKQAVADAQPLISRSVPRINKLIAQADADARLSTREQKAVDAKEEAARIAADKAAADKAVAEKAAADKAAADKAAAEKARKPEAKPLSKFPSGRAIELPAPTEAWTLSGTADADIADYAFGGAKATIIVRAHAGAPSCEHIKTSAQLLSHGRSVPQATEPSSELKPLRPAWLLAWTQDERQVRAVCVGTGKGVVVGRTEAGLAGNAPLDVTLARMISARLKK